MMMRIQHLEARSAAAGARIAVPTDPTTGAFWFTNKTYGTQRPLGAPPG